MRRILRGTVRAFLTEQTESQSRSSLLGRFLTVTIRLGQDPASRPDADTKSLVVLGACLTYHMVFRKAQSAALQPFLER